VKSSLSLPRGPFWSVLALVALSTAGCSWIFTQPLRDDRSPYDYPVCSTNPAPPIIDSTLFMLNAGTTIYTAAQDDVSQKALRVSIGATSATLWLLSAIYGYAKISECMAAIGSHETGYHRPAIGTGGEVFLQQPPPSPSPPSRPPQQPGQPAQPGNDDEDPLHPRLRPHPVPIEKPDAPRFGG
jgi:hypothetical protein